MDNRVLLVAARILIPSVFVGLGIERLLIGAGVLDGPPVSAGALVFSALELVAGILVMIGWNLRTVASLLAIFILADAFMAHPFWNHAAEERHGQLLHFLKNFSTLGGLLMLVWFDRGAARRL